MTHCARLAYPTFGILHGIEGYLTSIKEAHGGGQRSILEGPHWQEEGVLRRRQ